MDFPQGYVDLRAGDPLLDDPAGASGWSPERTLRAEVIVDMLTGGRRGDGSQPPDLVLSGALIRGVLDLRGRDVRQQVLLRGCVFEEPPLLEEATCGSLRLSGCRLPGIHAPWLISSDSVYLRDCQIDGQVDLTGAHIRGQLILSHSHLLNPDAVAVLARGLVVAGDVHCGDGTVITGECDLAAARVGGEVRFSAAELNNPAGFALRADRITVEKGMYYHNNLKVTGTVSLQEAQISGPLIFNHTTIENPGQVALDCGQIVVGEHLHHDDFQLNGELSLVAAQVGGEVRFSSSTLSNPGAVALRADLLTVEKNVYGRRRLIVDGEMRLHGACIGGQLNFTESTLRNPGGVALAADHLVVGSLYCHNGFVAEGEILLDAAHVRGEIQFSAAQLRNPGATALRANRLVVSDNMSCCAGSTVDGTIQLNSGVIAGRLSFAGATLTGAGGTALCARQLSVGSHLICDDRFTADGTIELTDADIGGKFNLNTARLSGPDSGSIALRAPYLVVGVDITCREGFTAEGSLLLEGAHISGHFSLTGASISVPGGVALDAMRIEVGENMSCDDGFRAEGKVSLRRAHIANNLDFRNAELKCPDGVALDAEDLRADRMLMPKEVRAGKIILRNARLNELDDKCEVMPEHIDVTGLSYETLIPTFTPQRRLEWLARGEEREDEVDPQPYEQMARSYRRLGYDDHARTVLLAKERRLHAKGSRAHRLWGMLQDKTIHYGYSPARAGVGLVVLLVVGSLFYWLYPPLPVPEFTGAQFNPFLYTLDLLVPIAGFGQRWLWSPDVVQQVVGSVIVVFGWTLATMAVIGMIRVSRR